MLKHEELMPSFIKSIPRQLEPGVLYISREYETAIHSCCCGCGYEVVTPLTATDWQLTNNSGKVSLWPSVGNWNLPCRSHYVIRNNHVFEADSWSDEKIKAAKRRDKVTKAEYYANINQQQLSSKNTNEEVMNLSKVSKDSWWKKLWKWLVS